MAKLKYDRVINISLTGKNVATIPKDEVWKVSIGPGYGSRSNLYGGGYNFEVASGTSQLFVSGIAFKHIDE